MELKLYKEIINELKNSYEDIDYFIDNPTEEFKYLIENDEYLKFDFSDIEKKLGVKLRYYQKLAVYFSNYYLNNFFDKKQNNQLAYWMATGSGKTLIMKADIINYLNYLKQKGELKTNSQIEIIITSSLADLIEQLREEFAGFVEKLKSDFNIEKITIDTIQSLMNKDEYNQTLQPNEFRIVLADEAHIGLSSKSSAFKEFKDKLVKNKKQSFLFEYSATFYEISDELQKEYEEKIVFDYNYDKFFRDFYGKDFKFGIIKADALDNENIQENIKQNLNDFNEKLTAFEKCNKFEDKPLLVVVGNKVNVKSSAKKEKESLKNELSDVLMFIEEIINLNDEQVKNYEKIFNTSSKTDLYLIYNRTDDELLLAFDENNPFGLVNVGDSAGLIKELRNKNGVVYREKNFIDENWKFKNIDSKNSPINILIGSRKFSAGWNSFRVSQICLINFGVGKGNTIIQIFGRGVRLKGIKNDGKRRTNYVDENSFKTEFKPYSSESRLSKEEYDNLKYLETLFIYSLKSTYLKNFIEAHTSIFKQKIILKKEINKKCKVKSIVIKNDFDFVKIKKIEIKDGGISYEYDNKKYEFDINFKLKLGESELEIDESLWNYIQTDELEKFIHNKDFVIDLDTLKDLVRNKKIKIFYDEELSVKKFENLIYKLINNFEKYIFKKIEKKKKSYKIEDIEYPYDEYKVEVVLEKKADIDMYKKILVEVVEFIKEKLDKNCQMPEIDTLKVLSKVTAKEQKVDIEKLFEQINISCHNPIALHPEKNLALEDDKNNKKSQQKSLFDYIKEQEKNIEKISISPDSLDKYEKRFLDDLTKYINEKKLKVKVLRNIPKKGSGIIGEEDDFYPDFVIEYKKDKTTHIIFCDPKGIRDPKNLFKVCLAPYLLKELEQDNLKFHSFIISHTDLEDINWPPVKGLSEDKCFDYFNLLFYRKEYIKKIFEKIENDTIASYYQEFKKTGVNNLEDNILFYFKFKDKFEKIKNIQIIEDFFNDFETKSVNELNKDYDICSKAIKKDEILRLFVLKYIINISQEKYNEICNNLSSLKELFKNKKNLISEIVAEIFAIPAQGILTKFGKALIEDVKRNLK